LRSAWAV